MTKKKMLIAFILNLGFSIFELIGGIFTNSISILSDALHDFGDSLSIGLAYIFERKSEKKADIKHTYGFARYSIIGALITTVILLVGCVFIVINAIDRFFNPEPVVALGVLIFAVVGIVVNSIAVFITSKGKNISEKAINLHLLEDVMGWVIVFIGSLVMYFTSWFFIDPILSILLAIFILYNVFKNLKVIFNIFLEKTPNDFKHDKFVEAMLKIEPIENIHHIHVWTLDGLEVLATFHIILPDDFDSSKEFELKQKIKQEALDFGIGHCTVEFERKSQVCANCDCGELIQKEMSHHGHHHHLH